MDVIEMTLHFFLANANCPDDPSAGFPGEHPLKDLRFARVRSEKPVILYIQ